MSVNEVPVLKTHNGNERGENELDTILSEETDRQQLMLAISAQVDDWHR